MPAASNPQTGAGYASPKTKIISKKEVKQMVELDLFKQKLNAYKQPLVEVRDSL